MGDPYEERYTSKEMQLLHSDEAKFTGWRTLWFLVAKAQKEAGLTDSAGKPRITDAMLSELETNISNLNLSRAKEIEEETRHDVMAHIKAYGEQCPTAKGILHLALTSRAVTDNCELVLIKDSMKLIRDKLANAINYVAEGAEKYSEIITFAFTHFQPAQATLVGRRLAMHGEELHLALDDLEHRINTLPLRGLVGPVGTHTDLLSLFDNDPAKVAEVEKKLAGALGFSKVLQCPGQTYHRMIDYQVGSALTLVNIAARRFATTIRLMQGLEEMEEPFEEGQVGSTAMPWKRNPKNSERMSSLSYGTNFAATELGEVAANQWLEGSVEDSAARRIKIREMFYATDAVLELYIDIARGVKVYTEMINAHVTQKLPIIAMTTFLMGAVRKGGDRQQLHEYFKNHAHEAITQYRAGGTLDFLDRIVKDQRINLSKEEIDGIMKDKGKFVGDALEQTLAFVASARERVKPYAGVLGYVPKVAV